MHTLLLEMASKNIFRGCDAYLNGFRVWRYEENGTFARLGHYIGYGICYEMAALLMLVWEDYPKTRYVFGKSWHLERKEWIDHSWMEIKYYGIWWVIDAAWRYPAFPIPKIWYQICFLAKPVRVIPHQEFFSHPLARELAEGIKSPQTSYFFHDLVYFARSTKDGEDLMVLEAHNIEETRYHGRRVDLALLNIFTKKRPITQRIIRQFLLNDRRRLPKRRDFRRAVALQKKIDKILHLLPA